MITIIQVVYRNAKDMKITFEDYAGELTNDKMKELTAKLKKPKHLHLIFSHLASIQY